MKCRLPTSLIFLGCLYFRNILVCHAGSCNAPLGLSTMDVTDGQFISSKSADRYPSWRARLYQDNEEENEKAAWTAGYWNTGSFIGVDFIVPHKITSLAVQGYPLESWYCKTFSIDYNSDGSNWEWYKGTETVIDANINNIGIETRHLDPFIAQQIRLHPKSWNWEPAMRLEFYGCVEECPKIPLSDMIQLPQFCSCKKPSEFGAICNTNNEIILQFTHLYIFTSIKLLLDEPLGGAPSTATIHFKDHDGLWAVSDVEEITIHGALITATYPRPFRSKSVMLKLVTSKPTWCARVTEVNACKAPACPPNYVHYKRSCYHNSYPHEIKRTPPGMPGNGICSDRLLWGNRGHLATINDFEESLFLGGLASKMKHYIGLFIHAESKPPGYNESYPEWWYKNADGTDFLLHGLWHWNEPLENGDYYCGGLHGDYTGRVYLGDCDWARNYICEVETDEYGDDWVVYVDRKITSVVERVTIHNVRLAACLRACQDKTDFLCLAAEHDASDYRCKLFDETLNLVPFATSSTSYWMLFKRVIDAEPEDGPIVWGNSSIGKTISVSNYQNEDWAPEHAEWRKGRNFAWHTDPNADYHWFQVTFENIAVFKKLEMDGQDYYDGYITQFNILYSNTSSWLQVVKDQIGRNMNFLGLRSEKWPQGTLFSPPLVAKIVRIRTMSWSNHVMMKFEMYGYEILEEPTLPKMGFPLGMESEDIIDGQMDADTEPSSYVAFRSRFNLAEPLDDLHTVFDFEPGSWWKLDLLLNHTIYGFMFQSRDSDDDFVKGFNVRYGTTTWFDVEDLQDSQGNIMLLETKVRVRDSPLGQPQIPQYIPIPSDPQLVARHFQLRGVSGVGNWVGRLELYGEVKECPTVASEAIREQTTTCIDCNDNEVCLSKPDTMTITFNYMYLVTGIVFTFPDMVPGTFDIRVEVIDPVGNVKEIYDPYNNTFPSYLSNGSDFVNIKLGRLQRSLGLRIHTIGVMSQGCAKINIQACQPEPCPPGYVQLRDKCIRFVNKDVSMDGVNIKEKACPANQGWNGPNQFVTFADLLENGLYNAITYRLPYTWIGLFRVADVPDPIDPSTSYTWRWVDDTPHENKTFRNWNSGEPDERPGEKATLFRPSGDWYDYMLSTPNRYSCETPAAVPEKGSGGVWTVAVNIAILGFNYLELPSNIKRHSCLKLCKEDPQCRSIDLKSNGRCYLQTVGLYHMPPGINYYEPTDSDLHTYHPNAFRVGCNSRLIFDEIGQTMPGVRLSARNTKSDTTVQDASMEGQTSCPGPVAWEAAVNDIRQWYQVDFGQYVEIRVLAVVGHPCSDRRLRKFYLQYSNDSLYWEHYRRANQDIMEFSKVYFHKCPFISVLDPEIYTRFIRIQPRNWEGGISMRVQAYGCPSIVQGRLSCGMYLRSWAPGGFVSESSVIEINGERVLELTASGNRGIHLAIVNTSKPVCQLTDQVAFDTSIAGTADVDMVNYIRDDVLDGMWILGVAHNTAHFISGAVEYFNDNLSIPIHRLGYNNKMVFAVQKGYTNTANFRHDYESPKGKNVPVLLHDIREIYGPNPDHAPLGMVSRDIGASQLDTNKISTHFLSAPIAMRLNSLNINYHTWDFWGSDDLPAWAQVTLLSQHIINAVSSVGSETSGHYTKSFTISYSNSLVETFTSQTDPNGDIVEYEANYDAWKWRTCVKTMLVSPISAKIFRFHVKTYSGKIAVKMELHGHPAGEGCLDVSGFSCSHEGPNEEPVTSGSCVDGSFSCITWCNPNQSNLTIHLQGNHMFSHLNIASQSLGDIPGISLKMFKRHNATEWKEHKGLWSSINNGTNMQSVIFSPLLVAAEIRLHIPAAYTGCFDFAFYGSRTKACPPGMIQYKKKCIYTSDVHGRWFSHEILCEDVNWMGGGRGASPQLPEEQGFLGKLLYMNSISYAWLGGNYSSGTYYWRRNYETLEVADETGFNWLAGQPNGWPCLYVSNMGQVGLGDCNSLNHLICEAEASVIAGDCEEEWVFYPQGYAIPSYTVYHTFSQTKRGLEQCLNECGISCKGVNYVIADGTCSLTNISLVALPSSSLVADSGKVYIGKMCHDNGCTEGLVSSKVVVGDVTLTATSELAPHLASEGYAYNFASGGFWYPTSITGTFWLKASFTAPVKIGAVGIQGNNGYWGARYVTRFTMIYTSVLYDGVSAVLDAIGSTREFYGNEEATQMVTRPLAEPILTSNVYILPTAWYSWPTMRLELIGCNLPNEKRSDYKLGMVSDDITLGQVTGSSYATIAGTARVPDYGRLDNPHKWCPDVGTDRQPWIQIDLHVAHNITAMSWQATDLNTVTMMYSFDGIGWDNVTDIFSTQKVFDVTSVIGGMAVSSEMTPVITARYIRIYLETYTTQPCLAVEVYGIITNLPVIELGSSLYSISSSSEDDSFPKTGAVIDDTGVDTPKWCPDISDADPYLEVNLGQLYLITGFSFEMETNVTSFKLNISLDGTEWKEYRDRRDGTKVIELMKDTQLTGVQKVKVMRLFSIASSGQACLQFKINGLISQACPPGFTQYESDCFMPTDLLTDQDEAVTSCERVYWESSVYPTSPNNFDSLHFVNKIRPSPDEYWTGIRKTSQWEYPGGIEVSTDLPWEIGSPGALTCATLAADKPRLVGKACNEAHRVICQTKAQNMPGRGLPRWMYKTGYRQAGLEELLPASTTTACLSLCLVSDTCKGVNYNTSSSKCFAVQLSESDPDSDVTADTSTVYYELYFQDPSCPEDGLIDGLSPILDAQITGTVGVDASHGLDKTRMKNVYPAVIDNFYWKTQTSVPAVLNVDLGYVKLVKRFAIQGSASETDELYPTEYFVLFTELEGDIWKAMTVPTIGSVRFPALSDRYERHEYPLSPPARVRRLQIQLTASHPAAGQTSVHLELYGCSNITETKGCQGELGFKDGTIITGTQTTVSSYFTAGGIHSSRHAAAIGFSGPAQFGSHWSPRLDDYFDAFFMVDLLVPHEITGIALKGDTGSAAFVTSFFLAYETNGLWSQIYQGGSEKVFPGCFEETMTYYTNVAPSVTGSRFKIYPVTYSGAIAMQVEFMGCPINKQIALDTGTSLEAPFVITNGCQIEDHLETDAGSDTKCQYLCTSNQQPEFMYKFPGFQRLTGITILSDGNSSVIQALEVQTTLNLVNWDILSASNFTMVNLDQNSYSIRFRRSLLARAVIIIIKKYTAVGDGCFQVLPQGSPATGCPPGFVQVLDTCIAMIDPPGTWETAVAYCSYITWHLPAELADLDNIYKANMGNALTTGSLTWLHGSWDGAEYKWNNRPMTWHQRGLDSPPAASDTCVYLNGSDTYWYDQDCTESHSFLCQVPSLDDRRLLWSKQCGQWVSDVNSTIYRGTADLQQCLQMCVSDLGCHTILHDVNTDECFSTEKSQWKNDLIIISGTSGQCTWEKHILDMCEKGIMYDGLYGMVITSSSSTPPDSHTQAPLSSYRIQGSGTGHWRAGTEDSNQWIQVVFEVLLLYSRLVVTGSVYDSSDNGWITSFSLDYTKDTLLWQPASLAGNNSNVYSGVSSQNPLLVIPLRPLLGRGIKIKPVSWIGHIDLQMEIFACAYTGVGACLLEEEPTLQIPGKHYVTLECLETSTILLQHEYPGLDSLPVNLEAYLDGFGFKNQTYWLGHILTGILTASNQQRLRIDMWDSDGKYDYAEFTSILVKDDAADYALSIGTFLDGSNGDGELDTLTGSTFQAAENDGGCVSSTGAPWWYNLAPPDCTASLLFPNADSEAVWGRDQQDSDTYSKTIHKIIARIIPTNSNTINIAALQSANQSITLNGNHAGLAVDMNTNGILSAGSCAQTAPGPDQWLSIDLGRQYYISRVTMHNRADCCGDELKDIIIKVGNILAITGETFDSSSFVQCATFTGPSVNGAVERIDCDSPVSGSILLVEKTDMTTGLTLCEVEIFTETVQLGLNDTCYWNHECNVTNSECTIKHQGSLHPSFTCQCKYLYAEIDGECFAVADVGVVGGTIDTAEVYRNYEEVFNISISLLHTYGRPFPTLFGSSYNLNITGFVAKRNCEGNISNCGYGHAMGHATDEERQLGASVGDNWNITAVTKMFVPAQQCSETQYICVAVNRGDGAEYIDPYLENNLLCTNISQKIICQPDIDISVQPIGPAFDSLIPRGGLVATPLNIMAVHPGEDTVFDVVPLVEAKYNFRAYYISSLTLLNNATDVLVNTGYNISNMTNAERQKGIAVGVTTNIYPTASFTDTKLDNNIACVDLSARVNCAPELVVEVTGLVLPVGHEIVRGYNISVPLNVTIVNRNDSFSIERLSDNQYNFNITMWIVDSDMKLSAPSIKLGVAYNAEPADLQQGLKPGQELMISLYSEILIPRDSCANIQYLCTEILPGTDSTYSLPQGSDSHIYCINLSPYKNCIGKVVENGYITSDPPLIMENSSTTFSVNLTKGTDIVLSVDFDDGTPTFNWNWLSEGHVTHFEELDISVSHTYTTMGNYTIQLNIGNDAGTTTRQTDVFVEPDLKNHLQLAVISDPEATPMLSILAIHLNAATQKPILTWCDVDYGDSNSTTVFGSLTYNDITISNHYTFEATKAIVTATCYNHVSSYNMSALVKLQSQILGLSVMEEKFTFQTGSVANFTVSMTNGSHVSFRVLFGDGSQDIFSHPDRLSYINPYVIQHIYSTPGNFTVNITAMNDYFNASLGIQNIIVQNPVHTLILTGPPVVKIPPGTADFLLSPADNGLPLPTDVFCTWHLSQPFTEYSVPISANQDTSRSHVFTRDDCGTDKFVNVTCYNEISVETAVWNLTVQEEVTNINTLANPAFGAPGNVINISITVTSGSAVKFDVTFGDGDSDTKVHPQLFASDQPIHFSHSYSTIGNHSLGVTGSNLISYTTLHGDIKVIIQNRISNLALYAPEKVLWPPGLIDFTIHSKTSQPLLENVHCLWEYDTDLLWQRYVDSLNTGQNINNEFQYPRSSVGNVTAHVNCSNLISWQNVSVPVEIELDEVILHNLKTNGSVLWNFTSEIILDVRRFGKYSCFLFDVGDEIGKIMYGVEECQTNATEFGIDFIKIPFGQMRIIYSYVYEEFGVFHASVFAFNHVSNQSLYTEVVVLDWPCVPPNITLPEPFTDKDNPFTNMKSQTFSISPNISIDCMKTDYYSVEWKVYNILDADNALYETFDETFQYQVRMFPYGSYIAEIYVKMVDQRNIFNVEGMEKTETAYFEIVKTPLIVNIVGNSTLYYKYNRTFSLDALSETVDLDVEPGDKSGFIFSWFCKGESETWPLEGDSISKTSLRKGMFDPLLKHGGCFGYGAGVMESEEGLMTNSTVDMFPYNSYNFHLEVRKDTRIVYAEVNMTVGPVDSPGVTLICRDNCESRRSFSRPISYRIACFSTCKTKFGSLSYAWRLFLKDQESDTLTEVLDFRSRTSNGISGSTIEILTDELEWTRYYVIQVSMSTPFSANTTINEEFLVNKPPYGGDCTISPTEGIAVTTEFFVNCFGWQEWLPDQNSPGLKYEYRIKQTGASRDLLFYFGNDARSSASLFPVGSFEHSFGNIVVVYVFDSVGDSWKKLVNVTVFPQMRPRQDVANEIFALASGDDPKLMKQLEGSDIQGALTTIYSATSLLNVPPTWTPSNISEEERNIDMSALMKTRKKARGRFIEILAAQEIDSVDALEQQNEVFRSTLLKEDEVDLGPAEKATGKVEKMISSYQNFKSNFTKEKSKQVAVDIVSTTLRVMIAADYINTEDKKAKAAAGQYNVNNSLATTEPPLLTTIAPNNTNEFRERVGGVMKGTIGAVHDISDMLVNDAEMGDPPTDIKFSQMTLMLGKEDENSLSNAAFSANQGGLKLPDINKLLNKTTEVDEFGDPVPVCYERQMMFSKINPYMWDISADEVTSPVSEFNLVKCGATRSRRRKRDTTARDTLGDDIEVELSLDKPESAYVNASEPDAYGLVYQELNITNPPKPIQISIFPLGNRSLEVFINITESPTPTAHRWNMTVPRNLTLKPNKTEHSIYLPAEDLYNGTLIVAIREGDCLPDHKCTELGENVYPPFEYNITLQDIVCQLWDQHTETWIQSNCKVEESTPEKVRFKSNLFGSFGAGLFTPPNTINFKEIFDNLGQKLLDNLPVVLTITITALLFIPLAIICRRFDKKDKIKWKILPLIDNVDEDKYRYEMHVYTGTKNSVTKSNVSFVLAGMHGDTGIRSLKDGIRQNFRKGEVDSFLVSTAHDIGAPLALQIWHDNSGQGKHAGWFLSKIIVVDLQEHKWYLFLCDDWLSVDEGDGRIERLLKVSSSSDSDADTSAMLSNNINQKLFEDHIWLSVGYRRNKSPFTRVQRLACCFAILFLAMVVNAMWYGTESEETTHSAIEIGPISFTVHELFTSFMASLIIFPPSIFIITFFAKSAQKPKKIDDNIPKDYKRPKGTLPYWCAYIAWVVTGLCIIVCVFFAIMYSLQFDKGKSSAWLLAFLFSFVQSVILMQPLKVIFMAVLLTFLFKKDSDVTEYEQRLGKMTEGNGITPDLAMQNQVTVEELEAAKKKREIDHKMRAMMREIAYIFIFLLLLIYVCTSNQDSNVFYQNQNLRDSFENNIQLISSPRDVYKWMKSIVIPNLYFTALYTEEPTSKYDRLFLDNMAGYRLGPPRLRQQRVKNETCAFMTDLYGLERLSPRCTEWYSLDLEDKADYNGKWGVPLNKSDMSAYIDNVHHAYMYKTKADIKGEPFWGFLTTYSGGGYIANLGNNAEEAADIIDGLQNSGWLDEMTRAIFLEFNVWNANTNLFNQFLFLLEFPPTGQKFSWRQIDSVQLYRYAGAGGVIALFAEIACIIFVIISAILEIRAIIKLRSAYMKEVWNLMQLCAICLFFISMGFYINRSLWTTKLVEEVMNNRDKTVNFQPLTLSNNMFLIFLALTAFLVQLQLLHILRYSKTVAMLGATIMQSGSELLNFAMTSSILFMGFASGAHLLFYTLESYRSLQQTMSSLTAAFLGKFDFVEMIAEFGVWGGFYLLFYLIMMMFFIVNLFIVILNEYVSAVKEDEDAIPDDHVVMDHLFSIVGSLVGKKKLLKNKDSSESKMTLPGFKIVENMLQRLDLIIEIVDSYTDSAEKETLRSALTDLIMEEGDDTESVPESPPDVDDVGGVPRSWSAEELMVERDKLVLGGFRISDFNLYDSEKAYDILLNLPGKLKQ